MKTKIEANEAWDIISHYSQPLAAATQRLIQCVGYYSAKEIFAPISLPPFDNSAVDGYALGSLASAGKRFQIVATIGAGEYFGGALHADEACQIMTGAKIPSSAKAVVMQEDVEVHASQIIVRHSVLEAENIRRAGEDVLVGKSVLGAGERILPAQIGLLSALGVSEIIVHRKPTVAIVSTGSELVDPGGVLQEGQVYYCTGPMLNALCEIAEVKTLSTVKIEDDKDAIIAALREAQLADVIIMIGGMARGLFDYGRYAFEKIGVEPIFFEGQWRPGKPLFFGRLGEKLVFGLPGNPVAAYVMFQIFIAPAIEKLSGGKGKLRWRKSKLVGPRPTLGDKSLFLRARCDDSELILLPGQGSHQLFSLAQANAVVWLSPHRPQSDEVDYLPIEA